MTENDSDPLTFEDAIQTTQLLLNQVQARKMTDSKFESEISALVKTEKGARGFFVTYLTNDGTFADTPTLEIINALKTSPEIVSELLVKNLAMSTATELIHRRNGDEDLASGSQKVQQRTINLIGQLPSAILKHKLDRLRLSLESADGDYQAFLNRWQYDTEQRQRIYQVVSELL